MIKQTRIFDVTVPVGEEEVDMKLTCDFLVDFGEPATTSHPGGPGAVVLVEASPVSALYGPASVLFKLDAPTREWLCVEMWEYLQSCDVDE